MSYTDLSSQVEVVNQQLTELGYREPTGAVVRDYDFPATHGVMGRADLLACADSRQHDIGTSCIAVRAWANGADKDAALRILSYVGAPIALLAHPQWVELWSLVPAESPETPELKATLPYDRLPEYFQTPPGRELAPRSLLAAKRGERQLTFFDIGPELADFARDATRRTLVNQFEEALDRVAKGKTRQISPALTRVAIRILATCILQDKLPDAADLRTRNVQDLLRAVRRRFPRYFEHLNEDLENVGSDAAERIYEALRAEYTFRSLTNDMLAHFYENALVRQDTRRKLGIYYTPRLLAQRILRRLPVEDLRPEDRIVLDGTCGSGNLLIAAYDRLSELIPAQASPDERHDFLRQRLWGIDADPFACEVARLSLLVRDLPNHDGWRIETGDVFNIDPRDKFGGRPHIIVGNPPFSEPRTSAKKKRRQQAAEVMGHYLEWLAPDGLLGVVLPLTFLENTSTREARHDLLRLCDILDVWQLPQGIFPESNAATAVVLARKLPQARSGAHSLLTRAEILPKGAPLGDFDQAATKYVVSQQDWFSHKDWQMVSSPLKSLWERLERQFPPIHPTFGQILNGVNPGKEANALDFSHDDNGPEWRRVLRKNAGGKVLEPFAIHWDAQDDKYIRYPSPRIERPRTPAHFDLSAKVITNATRNSSSPWRFYAAIDRSQLVVTGNFQYILPHAASEEVLAAVLNSMVANMWFSSRNNQRDIKLSETLQALPFPTFTPEQSTTIRRLVRRVVLLKQKPTVTGLAEVRHCISVLDDWVFDAYGVADAERNYIRQWLSGYQRPGIEWVQGVSSSDVPQMVTHVARYRGQSWLLTGEIASIDAQRRTIRVSTEDQDEPVELPIPDTMPGWMLRPGVAFQAQIPWEERHQLNPSELTWLAFQPLGFGYLSDEELSADMSVARR